MDKLGFAVRFVSRAIMPESLKPVRIGTLWQEEFLTSRNIRWKSTGVV
jgi:hypothetical protein